ncbi:MAG: HD domain-containing protein [Bdellovibrionales bacterium]|nr:HD domain-containing protein [Bdellovibrionales bacterium]
MENFQKIMSFVKEVDRLKTVERQCQIMNGGRRENSAEHSWHFALTAWLLGGYAHRDLNMERVVKMALIHDLVEIDAGDTFVYDHQAREEKKATEEAAAHRLFALLPADLEREFWELWREYEDQYTDEARFAQAIDRLLPILCNTETEGSAWRRHGISRRQVDRRNGPCWAEARCLEDYVTSILDEAVARGHLTE